MALDPRIILAGRQPDVVNALAGGAQAANTVNTVRRQNALADLYQAQGPGILAGEQDAMNALAQLSPEAAMGIQNTQQTMDVRGQENARADERLQMAREQARREAQAHLSNLSAAEAAAERERLDRALAGASRINDPETWDQYMTSLGRDELVGQFDNREVIIASALGLKDALEMQAGPDLPSSVEEYQFAQSQGFEGSYQDWITAKAEAGRDQNTVRVDMGGDAGEYLYGSDAGVPAGWRVHKETGIASPIPNGPVEQEQEAADVTRQNAADQTERAGNVVLEDIGRVREMLKGGRNEPITGAAGALASRLPGSEATDARALTETIKANIGFDRLQQMREASPTGGALGQVTERELATLQAVMGNLEFSQSKEQLLENLDRLEEVYTGILDKAARTGDGTFVPRQGKGPETAAPSDAVPANPYPDEFPDDEWATYWRNMTPEERALFQ